MEVAGEAIKLLFGAGGVDQHGAVVEVAGIAREAEFARVFLNEPAVADALDAAVDYPFPGRRMYVFRRGVHLYNSIMPAASLG